MRCINLFIHFSLDCVGFLEISRNRLVGFQSRQATHVIFIEFLDS